MLQAVARQSQRTWWRGPEGAGAAGVVARGGDGGGRGGVKGEGGGGKIGGGLGGGWEKIAALTLVML